MSLYNHYEEYLALKEDYKNLSDTVIKTLEKLGIPLNGNNCPDKIHPSQLASDMIFEYVTQLREQNDELMEAFRLASASNIKLNQDMLEITSEDINSPQDIHS